MAIIISRKGEKAEKIEETGVAAEDYLQQYIEENPDVLPMDDIKEGVRLMTVGREFPTDSGPIDVLAVDDEGDLYLIETKLFKNPDKRKVIAQVLDYGAALWRGYSHPSMFVEDLDRFMKRKTGEGLSEQVTEFFACSDEQLQEIKDAMQARLSSGSFKFVILMDKLAEPLKNLIQFMNERTSFDIYAVEMEFYQHEGLEIVIPKLFGAQVKKSIADGSGRPRGLPWDEDRFFNALADRCSNSAIIEVAKELFRWVTDKDNADYVYWGEGSRDGSFGGGYNVGDHKLNGFVVYTYGSVEIYFGPMANKPPFAEESKRLALRDKLNAIEGIDIPPDAISKRPSISLEILVPPKPRAQFIKVLDWLANEIRNSA